MADGFTFSGIIPANILPFKPDFSIDEKNYRRHLSWLANTSGVTGIVCNGHAAEVSSLTRDERRRVLAIALDEVGHKVPLISGIYTDSTLDAVELARDAKAEGANGLLIFPPSLFMFGVHDHPTMVYRYYAAIADAVDLPMVVFQYPLALGLGYQEETLVKLTEIEQVVAVKEWSNDILAFEKNLRAIRTTGRPVAILSSFTMSLYASFLLGADGAISGMGSVAADFQVRLFDFVNNSDLDAGSRLNDRLAPLVSAFYGAPFIDMHNRMKEALAMLGRIDTAVVRPPLQLLNQIERERIRAALVASGISE
jgi:4-hydroxy-tetrahydrodipicolinate synthase